MAANLTFSSPAPGQEMDFELVEDNNSTAGSASPGRDVSVYNLLSSTDWVYSACLLLAGISGNVFSAVIMMRRRFRYMSFSVYIFVLALMDTAHLFLNPLFRRVLGDVTGVHLTQLSNAACKFFSFLMSTTSVIGSWLLVAVCVERALAVAVPHRAKSWFTVRRSWLVVCAITCTVISMRGFLDFKVLSLTVLYGATICYYTNPFWGSIDTWLELLTYSFIPSVIIMCCNVTLFSKVLFSWRFRHVTGAEMASADSKMVRLSLMLAVTSTMFIILTLPKKILLCYSFMTSNYGALSSGYRMYIYLSYMSISNHAVNGYLYGLTGPAFRQELFALLGCGQSKTKQVPRVGNVEAGPAGAISAQSGNDANQQGTQY